MTAPTINVTVPAGDPWHRAAVRTAAVAALFSVVVLMGLLVNAALSRRFDPLKPARLHTLQLALNREPRNETLQKQVRALDLEVRRSYFRHRAFALTGFYLLLGGLALFALAAEAARQRRPAAPSPNPRPAYDAWAAGALGRRTTGVLAGTLAGVVALMAVLTRHDTVADYARAAGAGHAPSAIGAPPPVGAAGIPGTPAAGQSTLPPPPAPAQGAPVAGPAQVGPLLPVPVQPPPPGPAPAQGAAAPAGGPGTPATTTAATLGPPLTVEGLVSEEGARNWPRFRGPFGSGRAAVSQAPTTWDGAKGVNVLWKAPVPLPGWNSPIVWGNRVFVAGADKAKRAVHCFDADTGKLVWSQPVAMPAEGFGDLHVSDDAGYVPSTMATDGKRVYAIFVNGDIACHDFDGKELWLRRMGSPENHYGHASSLATYQDRLIVQYDQGSSPQDGKSVLFALDGDTGKTVWETRRPVPNAWSTPTLIKAGGREQVIVCGNPWVIAYDPATGSELWRSDSLNGEVAVSVTFGGGYVFTCNQGAALTAIRPGGTGNVSKTQVAWTSLDAMLPDISSPTADDERIYIMTTEGMLTCMSAATGKKLWEHFYDGATFKASPTLVGNRLYLLESTGQMRMVEAGPAFKELGTAPLGEEAFASPAFVGKRIYIRAKQNLYCIEEK